MEDQIIMPSMRKDSFVQFFYTGDDEPFICGADGHFTSTTLGDIEEEFLEDYTDIFTEGAGDYLFKVWQEPAVYGDYGAVEQEAHWEWRKESYNPIDYKPKTQ